MDTKKNTIPVVILAGGEGSRMGGLDKCLLKLGEKTLLTHLIKNLSNQSDHILLNANGDPNRFKRYQISVISDHFLPTVGPLGGIVSTMRELQAENYPSDWVQSVPGDCPFLPNDLVSTLLDAADAETDIVYCHSEDRDHYVSALWSTDLLSKIVDYLESGERSVGKFIRTQKSQKVHFASVTIDPFFNINTHTHWQTAKQHLEEKH